MPLLRLRTEIDAPSSTVAGVLRDARTVARALAGDGHRVAVPARLLVAGDEVRLSARLWLGIRVRLRMRVASISDSGMVSSLLGGPWRELVQAVTLTPSGSGTSMVDELRWSGLCGAAEPVVRAFGRRTQAARAAVVRERVVALRTPPSRVVVATALIRDGRVLAARRTEPASCAGRWELAGGSVEPGESEAGAVVRECREELATDVVVTGRIGTDLPIDVGLLRVYTATLAPGAPEPRAVEHSALRWVGPAELAEVPWLDGDRAVVPELVDLLGRDAQ